MLAIAPSGQTRNCSLNGKLVHVVRALASNHKQLTQSASYLAVYSFTRITSTGNKCDERFLDQISFSVFLGCDTWANLSQSESSKKPSKDKLINHD